MATTTKPQADQAHDTFPINGTDYLEFIVGNAKQSSLFYRAAFGFDLAGYRGPETGVRDRSSYLLVQNKLRFVLTTPLGPTGELAEHLRIHGDGVRDIAFWVDDARDAFAKPSSVARRQPRSRRSCGMTTARSSLPPSEPTATRSTRSSNAGTTRACSCRGSCRQVAVRSRSPRRPQVRRPLRGQRRARQDEPLGRSSTRACSASSTCSRSTTRHLHRVLGVDVQGDVERQRPDQVPDQRAGARQEEVADRGVPRLLSRPGVQHIAVATDDIIKTVTDAASARGVEFLSVPASYYETRCSTASGKIDEDIAPTQRARHSRGPRR